MGPLSSKHDQHHSRGEVVAVEDVLAHQDAENQEENDTITGSSEHQ